MAPEIPGFGDLGGLLGESSIIRQILIWQVMGQLMGGLMAPLSQELANLMWARFPDRPLAPPDLADMVVRGILTQDEAAKRAALSGISADEFDLLVKDTGQAPDLTVLMEAFRRGFIQWDQPTDMAGGEVPSALEGIKRGHLRNEWAPLIEAMRLSPIPLGDAIDAWVEGQISEAQAKQIAYQNGISESDATILFNTRGRPPGPMELVDLVRRGEIPMRGTGPLETTLQQGIYEGATKDKWEFAYEKLVEYLPPPRTITALERAGVITPAKAIELYKKHGLSEEMATAYSNDASHQKLAPDKLLAKTTVLQLYSARLIDDKTATEMLGTLGYNATDAAWLMKLEDLQRALKAMNSAVTKIGNLYITRKITKTAAVTALNALQLPSPQVEELLVTWTLEQEANVRILTPAEIASAHHYQVIDQATATAELVALGYTPFDAWVLLSAREHAPLPNQPAQGPSPTGNIT